MITSLMINKELSTGLNFICSSCEHWHYAKLHMKNGEIQCGQECGGPAVGLGFPKYKGPFENNISKYCFICGEDSDSSVKIGNEFIGVCSNLGPNNERCIDKLRNILNRNKVVVIEKVVNVID